MPAAGGHARHRSGPGGCRHRRGSPASCLRVRVTKAAGRVQGGALRGCRVVPVAATAGERLKRPRQLPGVDVETVVGRLPDRGEQRLVLGGEPGQRLAVIAGIIGSCQRHRRGQHDVVVAVRAEQLVRPDRAEQFVGPVGGMQVIVQDLADRLVPFPGRVMRTASSPAYARSRSWKAYRPRPRAETRCALVSSASSARTTGIARPARLAAAETPISGPACSPSGTAGPPPG